MSPLTVEEKGKLSARLQDVLAKAWTLVGIPPIVMAAAALAKVEGDGRGSGDESSAPQTWLVKLPPAS